MIKNSYLAIAENDLEYLESVVNSGSTFYNQLAGYVGIFCGIMFLCSYIYLYKRSKNSIKEKSVCKDDIQLIPNNALAI